MIEELKALCIKILKSVDVDIENCLSMLFLASRYDFYLEDVSDFILSHLPELLPKDEMMLLDKESVRFINSNPMLAYVSREECFSFLVRWVSHTPVRESDFAELFACLDTDEISVDVLSTVCLDCLSDKDKLLCYAISKDPTKVCDVIVAYPPEYADNNNFLYVYNPVNKSWFQMLASRDFYWSGRPGVSISDKNTVISLKGRKKVIFYNIVTRNTIEKSLEIVDYDVGYRPTFEEIVSIDNKLYYFRNFTAITYKEYDQFIFIDPMRMSYITPQFLAQFRGKRKQSHDVCSLYVSEEEDGDKIIMRPVISVLGFVQSLSVTGDILWLLHTKKERILAFTEEENRIGKLDISAYMLDDNSYVSPCIYGGVYIVTKSHILQIDKRFGISDVPAYVSEFPIPNEENVDEYWSQNYPTKFEVLQDKIIIIERGRQNYENNITYQRLPDQISFLDKEEKIEIDLPEMLNRKNLHFLQAKLPKEILRCPLDCPHCSYKEPRERRRLSFERDFLSGCDFYDDYQGYYDDFCYFEVGF